MIYDEDPFRRLNRDNRCFQPQREGNTTITGSASKPTGNYYGHIHSDGNSFKCFGFRASHYSCFLVYGATKAMTTVKAQRHPARMNA